MTNKKQEMFMLDTQIKVEILKNDKPKGRYCVRVQGVILGKPAKGAKVICELRASVPYHDTVVRLQRLTRLGKAVSVEVIECVHCRRLGVALDGHRITEHKCAGQWTGLSYTEALLPAELLSGWRKITDQQVQIWRRNAREASRASASAKRKFLRATSGYSFEELVKVFQRLISKDARRDLDQWLTRKDGDELKSKAMIADHWGRQGHWTCADFVRGVDLEAIKKALARS